MSEDEIKEQIEQAKFFNYMRDKRVKDQMQQMETKEKQMEEEMGDLLVDINQERLKLKKANTVTASKSKTETTEPSSKHSSNKPAFNAFGLGNRFGVKPINQKKVQAV